MLHRARGRRRGQFPDREPRRWTTTHEPNYFLAEGARGFNRAPGLCHRLLPSCSRAREYHAEREPDRRSCERARAFALARARGDGDARRLVSDGRGEAAPAVAEASPRGRAFAAVGDAIPDVSLDVEFPPKEVSLKQRLAGRKVILVGLPGAFTPT